jgi:hypothetical protein
MDVCRTPDGGSRKDQLPQPLRYIHLWDYSDVFCTFLNFNCFANLRNGAAYIDNRVAFFDRFIYSQ